MSVRRAAVGTGTGWSSWNVPTKGDSLSPVETEPRGDVTPVVQVSVRVGFSRHLPVEAGTVAPHTALGSQPQTNPFPDSRKVVSSSGLVAPRQGRRSKKRGKESKA